MPMYLKPLHLSHMRREVRGAANGKKGIAVMGELGDADLIEEAAGKRCC